MAKSKKPKKNHRRTFRSKPTEVMTVKSLNFRKVSIKWLPRTDEFQVHLDMHLNGTHLLMLGSIDPDNSYFEGIRIFCKKPVPWMTCNDVYLLRENAPNFFAGIKGYFHTIGDLLDEGWDIDKLPTAQAYAEGEKFSDKQFLDLFQMSYPDGEAVAKTRLTSVTQLEEGTRIERVTSEGSTVEYTVTERLKGSAMVSEQGKDPFKVTFRNFRSEEWFIK